MPPSASVDPSAPPLASALDRAAPPSAAAVDRSAFLPEISSAVPDAGAPAAERDPGRRLRRGHAPASRGVTVARVRYAPRPWTSTSAATPSWSTAVPSGSATRASAGRSSRPSTIAGQVELWDALDGTSVRAARAQRRVRTGVRRRCRLTVARALVALTADAVAARCAGGVAGGRRGGTSRRARPR